MNIQGMFTTSKVKEPFDMEAAPSIKNIKSYQADAENADKKFATESIIKDSITSTNIKNSTYSTKEFLSNLEEKISTAKNFLEGIVKNYPPFLQGSEERVKYLKMISFIKKQIDAQTIPPPENVRSEKIQKSMELLKKSLGAINDNSSDKDIYDALDILKDVEESISKKKIEVVVDKMFANIDSEVVNIKTYLQTNPDISLSESQKLSYMDKK